MVDTMAILGAAACAKLTADRFVRDCVTYFRETSITSPAPCPTTSRRRRKKHRLSRPLKPSLSGLRPRPSSRRNKNKVSLMTDAELEAELHNRRRRRAKERDLYSRAMRSEKLAALESELADLRKEIGRVDPISSKPVLRPGTPHSVRWQPLPPSRRSLDTRASSLSSSLPLPPSQTNNTNPAPHPPPPPPPMPGGAEDDVLIVDPEKRIREKEERQRRREAKKKEREQTKKRMSLADIIKSAGPDPMMRLKPATRKAADLEKEEHDKQKRAREERERRQEKERIEQEKKTLGNMGRRVAEQTSTASVSISQESAKSGQPTDVLTSNSTSKDTSLAQDSVVSAEHKPVPSSSEQTNDLLDTQGTRHEESSEPTSANTSDEASDKGTFDKNAGSSVDSIQTTRTVTGERSESAESDPERKTRSTESQSDASLPIFAHESGGGQPRQHEKAHASNKSVAVQVDNKVGQAQNKKGGSNDPRGDTENTSPNAPSTSASLKEEPKKRDLEGNENSKCPTIS